jgi:hypothetical protein
MKKVFLGSLITILTVSAILAGIYYYQKVKMKRTDAFDAIPESASLIIKTKSLNQTFSSVKKSAYWKELLSISPVEKLEKRMAFLDSLVRANPALDGILGQGVVMSLHKTGYNEYNWLFLIGISDLNPEKSVNTAVNDIVQDKIPIAKRIFDGTSIIEITVETEGATQQLSYTVMNGLCIASFSPVLLEQSVREVRKNRQNKMGESFLTVTEAAGDNTDANFYLNYRNASPLLGRFLSQETSDFPEETKDLAEWSGLDLKYTEHGTCLNGLTSVTPDNYLSCFIGQEPQEVQVARIIPASAAFMMFWGISDFSDYYKRYKSYLAGSDIKSRRYRDWVLRSAIIKRTGEELGADIEKEMFSWVSNEIAAVQLESSDTALENGMYAMFRARDTDEAKRSLDVLREKSGGDSINYYHDYGIGRINIEMLLPRLLGASFARLTNTYYTIVGNYVVFADSEAELKYLIDENTAQKVLYREDHYQNFISSISLKSSLFLYTHFPGSLSLMSDYVSDSLARELRSNYEGLSRIGSAGIQYISDPHIKGFFTNVCLQKPFRKVSKTEVKEDWKLMLDSTVSMAPQYVLNHNTGEKEVIVQDDGNKLYLINRDGQILWSRQLPSKIMSRIFQVDAFKNNRLQFLFNTRLGLYLIDHNGNNVEKFPVRFKVPATNPVAVFDYENTRDYRIFVAGTDGIVYAYKADGTPVEGWTFNRPVWTVNLPVQHFSYEGKDYLLVSDSKGTTYILDRRGEKISIADKPLHRSKNNQWVMEVSDQPYFLTTDSSGHIFVLYMNGTTEVERITTYKPSHYFDFRDVNGDKLRDYIILNDGYLFVCNQDTTKIFDYVFPESASRLPMMMKCFTNDFGDPVIGVVSPRANTFYLFNSEGNIRKGFPVKGSTLFDVTGAISNGSGKKKGRLYIVTGSLDKNIYQYITD